MARRSSLFSEFFEFIKENKAYWIAPIVIVLLVVAIGILVGGSPIGPYLYTLF